MPKAVEPTAPSHLELRSGAALIDAMATSPSRETDLTQPSLRAPVHEIHVYASGELPDEILSEVGRAEMDPRHRHLDVLVADWTP